MKVSVHVLIFIFIYKSDLLLYVYYFACSSFHLIAARLFQAQFVLFHFPPGQQPSGICKYT